MSRVEKLFFFSQATAESHRSIRKTQALHTPAKWNRLIPSATEARATQDGPAQRLWEITNIHSCIKVLNVGAT